MSRAHLDADDAASLRRELAWLRKRDGFRVGLLVWWQFLRGFPGWCG